MFYTSDIAIAAYLMMNGLQLVNAGREKNGRFKFEFQDVDNKGPALSVAFVNSESALFDAHVKNLKNILYKT